MKKRNRPFLRFLSLLPVLAVAVCALLPALSPRDTSAAWDGSLAGSYYSGGAGTSASPYLIDNPGQLTKLAEAVNAGSPMTGIYFRLSNSLDLSNTGPMSGGYWVPIGTNSNRFKGHFDGNGYAISNLRISLGGDRYAGLFGVCQGSVIKNLTIQNASVSTTGGYAGAVGGLLRSCTLDNVVVTGVLTCSGTISSGTCYGLFAGAIFSPGTYTNCRVIANSAGGSVTGKQYLCGFVGDIAYESSGTVNFSNCTVERPNIKLTNGTASRAGGFFGDIDKDSTPNVVFRNCMVIGGAVRGYEFLGGFGFYLRSGSSMISCGVYNTDIADYYSGDSCLGGLLGSGNGTVINCYAAPKSLQCPNKSTIAGKNVGKLIGERLGNSCSDCFTTPLSATLSSTTVTVPDYGGSYVNTSTATDNNQIKSGQLAYALCDDNNGYYWTQKDGNMKHLPSTSLCTNSGTYPVPCSSAATATRAFLFYGEDLLTSTNARKFRVTFDNTDLSSATMYTVRETLYLNSGSTLNAVITNDSGGAGYLWYFTVGSTTLSDGNGSVPIPASSSPSGGNIILHGEKCITYSIRYYDGSTLITSSVTGPKSFTVKQSANVSTATYSKSPYVLKGWKNAAGAPITTVSTQTMGFGTVTLYADWDLPTEVNATDGRTYRIIRNFDQLELFRDLIKNDNTLNGILRPNSVRYQYLETGKVAKVLTVSTDTLKVQTVAQSKVLNYYALLYANEQYGVTTLDDLTLRQRNAVLAAATTYVNSLGLTWGTYTWDEPISATGYPYQGTFNGNGATISGVTYGGEATSARLHFGLFAYTGAGAVIKNLQLAGGSLTVTSGAITQSVIAAPLIAESNGYLTVTGCSSTVPVNLSGLSTTSSVNYAGGLMARASTARSLFTGCSVNAALNFGATKGYFGGLCGYATYTSNVINNCFVRGTLTSTATVSVYLSGIGYLFGDLQNSYFAGTVTGASTTYPLCYGGSGSANTTIDNCYYNSDCGATGAGGTAASTAEFNSGKICFLLQGTQSTKYWGQTSLASTTSYPVLSSLETTRVRRIECADGSIDYNSNRTPADVNSDYLVNAADFTEILNGSLGKANNINTQSNADFNGDGVIDVMDAAHMEQILKGHAQP